MTNGEDDSQLIFAAPEKTQEVGMSIDTILEQKAEIVNVLTSDVVERKLLLKELMITAYIGGFFAGTNHAHRDSERHEN